MVVLRGRFHGEAYGWEAQILRDGDLSIRRGFDARALAVQWADEQQKALEKGGG